MRVQILLFYLPATASSTSISLSPLCRHVGPSGCNDTLCVTGQQMRCPEVLEYLVVDVIDNAALYFESGLFVR